MKRRAQAALEFLTTYGWALLVILVMIGALVYFGLLNPSKALPSRCDVPPGFECKDFQITTTGFNVIIANKQGESLKAVTWGTVTSDAFLTPATGCVATTPDPATPTTWAVDEAITFTCTGAAADVYEGLVGSKVKASFNVFYTPVRATYNKTAQVTLFSAVQ
jgi:hypothetical protein